MKQADEEDRVLVPRGVLDGIEAVRLSGLTNMLDRPRVAQLGEELGFTGCARWIRGNLALYARGIFRGFQSVDDN